MFLVLSIYVTRVSFISATFMNGIVGVRALCSWDAWSVCLDVEAVGVGGRGLAVWRCN